MMGALLPGEFLLWVVCGGMLLVLAVFLPVQLASKLRRMSSARVKLACRICGYHFRRRDAAAICPHCGSRNR